MGYYTNHEIEIIQGGCFEVDYIEEIGEVSGYGSSTFEDDIKWYNHEKDMRLYSLKHPETVFALRGEGEVSGDLWIEYYKNGKMQRVKAQIVFDEFNAEKLS